MNQPIENKTQRKYKSLLYITANDKSSLQQIVSSAIITNPSPNEDDPSLPNILRLGGLIALELLVPVPLVNIQKMQRIIELINRSTPKNQDANQVKQNKEIESDIDKLLQSLNLEDWSAFITQIPYSSISEDLDFPPGHPLPNKLYRSHPLKSKSNTYIPIEIFDSLLYAEREAELIRLLVDLGAIKITIQEKQTDKTEAEAKAEAKITGAGGLEGNLKGELNKLNELIRSFSLEGNSWTPEIQNKFKEEKYSWLPYEPAWKAVVHARLYGKCLTASIELTNDNSYSISGKIGIAEGLLQNVAGLNAGASFQRNQAEVNLIAIEFAPSISDQSR